MIYFDSINNNHYLKYLIKFNFHLVMILNYRLKLFFRINNFHLHLLLLIL